jgi:hypothetical protein
MRRLGCLLTAGLVLAFPAFAKKPQIQWDEGYDFSQIGTFSWMPTAGETLEQSDPFLHSHIVNTIEYQLTSHGLTEVSENPDVLVTYYGSTDTEVRLQSDSYGYGWGGYGGPGWGYYGYGYGGYGRVGPVSTTTRVVEYETGTLIVDIVDARSDELIWRGTVSDISISNKPSKMQKNITKAIERMAKQSARLRERAAR